MEIRNHTVEMKLTPGIQAALDEVRLNRGFDAQTWLDAKCLLLNRYIGHSGLKSVVVAVSGGIDSAVVLGIAARAQRMPDSPIERIVAVTLPDRLNDGVTGQGEAASLAHQVCEAFGIPALEVDISPAVNDVILAVERAVGAPQEDRAQWCRGQSTSYVRTPFLYYVTSVLSAQGTPGVLLGTTNLSEGGYLGYFGKASDGMVDVQIVSDLYKSEVYQVAELLGVPRAVVGRAPTGDMYDATTDEVVFGAPYDYVELFMEGLRFPGRYQSYTDPEDFELIKEWMENLRRMHRYNAHKYLGRSPAVHLDIMPCSVPGGWNNEPPVIPLPKGGHIRGVFTSRNAGILYSDNRRTLLETVQPLHTSIPYENGLRLQVLNPSEIAFLEKQLPDLSKWEPVARDGYDFKQGPVGSWRASTIDLDFAALLWDRVRLALPSVRITNEMTPSDTEVGQVWKPVGVSDLMRFIHYERGGLLFPHYDRTFVISNNRRTLMSLVIQIHSSGEGGATRFIRDPQAHLPHAFKAFNDWEVQPRDEDIIVSIEPQAGQGIIFDHGLLHDGATVEGTKTILRTDIVFERAEWFD